MDFSEDFTAIQGVLLSNRNTLGDLTAIKYVGGNETKISKIVTELCHFLTSKKYMKNDKINRKYEMNLRRIVLFLILNTDLKTKRKISNNVSHLIGTTPQLSRCLLTNITFQLGLCEFYAEAISNFPAAVSLELLAECNVCIKKANPIAILELNSLIAKAIYMKIFYLRCEPADQCEVVGKKLLEKFIEVLKNYLVLNTSEVVNSPDGKEYQYLGRIIIEILNLMKACLETLFSSNFNPSYQFYQYSSGTSNFVSSSVETLNVSSNMLAECQIHLFSLCEIHVAAVTVDVFCSWTECKFEEVTLQQHIGELAYEVQKRLENFESANSLRLMLEAITIKPKAIHELIEAADEKTLLENVVVDNENQKYWFKALLKYGVLKSENVFKVFQSVVTLCDDEDYCSLLILGESSSDLGTLLTNTLRQLPENRTIHIITQYFIARGFNNIYENSNSETQLIELFNKISCGSQDNISLNEISLILLQNPLKFLTKLVDESDKNIDYLSSIIQILNFIKPICDVKEDEELVSIFFEIVVNKLKEYSLENPIAEHCITQLISLLIQNELIQTEIYEHLFALMDENEKQGDLKRATFICHICNVLKVPTITSHECVQIILRLLRILCKHRWNFFSFTEEKVGFVSELILLINHYKTSCLGISPDDLKTEAEKSKNKINMFHITMEESFLNYVSVGFDQVSNHNERVCRILKLLPSCVPSEWDLVAKHLVLILSPIDMIKLLRDFILVLSQMSNQSIESQHCFAYCFQQVCVVIKNIAYPLIQNKKEEEAEFIKIICKLIKHLPSQLHNSLEISLVNLFNFDVLKSLKNDEEFEVILIPICNLDICKIIRDKMNEN